MGIIVLRMDKNSLFAALLEAGFAYMIAVGANILFVTGVEKYLLKDSYFLLFTPTFPIYMFFFILLGSTAILSAFFCVYTFFSGLKSINEV